jgi:hypothetical protein
LSISSIDSISPTRSAATTWNDVMAMRESQADPMQQVASMIQQYIMELMMNLLAAAMRNQQPDPSQGGAGQPSGSGGLSGPAGVGGPAGNPMQSLGMQDIIKELLAALAPLFGGQQQMQPTNAANSIAPHLGGGAPQYGGGQQPFSAPQYGNNNGYPHERSQPLDPFASTPTSPMWSPTSSAPPSPTWSPPSPAPSTPPSSPPSSPTSSVTSTGKPGEIPPATGTVQVDKTIVVKAGETFDGGGKLYQAGPALGDGGRSEGQKPVFILEDGATLKNLQIAGADGVHAYGDATVQNVWWKDVGEDALTKKAAGDVRVIGGGANDAHDKVFVVAAGGSLSIEGFNAQNFGRLVATDHRFVPPRNDGTFPLEVSISNSKLTNGDEVFRTDAANARITFKDVDLNNVNYDARGPRGMEVIGGQKVGWVEGNVI